MTFKTERIFWTAEGEVLDRGDHWLVRTPSNPTYYGGNLLYFDRVPEDGDFERWLKLFEHEFNDQPEVRHVLFIWDMPEGNAGATRAFIDAGFEVQSNVTLLTGEIHEPPKMNHEIAIRRIERDEEWEAVLAFKIRLRDPRFDRQTYTPYKTKWLDVRRRLADSGRGDWYGAFLGDRLVGDLGIYRDGEVARFQDVMTEPEFRRRGICGTLVYEVSRRALESGSVKTLVMAADENYHAARIYESVGFAPKEWHAVACRYPAKN